MLTLSREPSRKHGQTMGLPMPWLAGGMTGMSHVGWATRSQEPRAMAMAGPAQGSNASWCNETPSQSAASGCGPQHNKGMNLSEGIQRRAMKMIGGLEPLS